MLRLYDRNLTGLQIEIRFVSITTHTNHLIALRGKKPHIKHLRNNGVKTAPEQYCKMQVCYECISVSS